MADYEKKSFGMCGGKEQTVKLQVDNTLVGGIIDRFGKNVIFYLVSETQFSVNVDVHISNQFRSWIMSL